MIRKRAIRRGIAPKLVPLKVRKKFSPQQKIDALINNPKTSTAATKFVGMLKLYAEEGMHFRGMQFESGNAFGEFNSILASVGYAPITLPEFERVYSGFLAKYKKL